MARRTRRLLDETLQKVIALREAGSSWLKIQQEVRIDRRTAKRAYEEWQRSKSVDELKAARKGIAAEEFRNHLHYLVALAEALAQTLEVPSQPNVTMCATDILDKMWEAGRLKGYSAYGVRDAEVKPETRKLLLNSLKTHSSAKVRWDALDEWEQAWDKCSFSLKKLQQETREVVNNIIEQKQLLQRIKRGSKKKDITERIVNGVLHTVWEQILRPTEPFPVVQTTPRADEQSEVLFGKDKFAPGIILDEADLAKQVAEVCKWGAKNVLSSPQTETVTGLIRIMRERIGELRQSLNPLLLGPQVMNTRCNLCPA